MDIVAQLCGWIRSFEAWSFCLSVSLSLCLSVSLSLCLSVCLCRAAGFRKRTHLPATLRGEATKPRLLL